MPRAKKSTNTVGTLHFRHRDQDPASASHAIIVGGPEEAKAAAREIVKKDPTVDPDSFLFFESTPVQMVVRPPRLQEAEVTIGPVKARGRKRAEKPAAPARQPRGNRRTRQPEQNGTLTLPIHEMGSNLPVAAEQPEVPSVES